MKSVRDIKVLENIPVLVRAALNEPVANGVVTDTFRLTRALPTLAYLQEQGARVIAISHIDETGATGVSTSAATLEQVAKRLGEMLPRVSFCPQTIGAVARDAIRKMAPGDVLVLENLRRNRGEVMNDPAFARELATLGDVFVQDSFDTCHRKHASIIGLPTLLPAYAGLDVVDEVRILTQSLKPKSPSFAIIGGAKFATKEPVLAALLKSYDKVFVGGALANDFLKAAGHTVGASLVSDADAEKIKSYLSNPRLVLPIDSRVVRPSDQHPASARVATLGDVHPDEIILDHGPATEALLASICSKSKQILWNGPMGKYESGFIEGTDSLARSIAGSGAYSVVGGGDTIAAIEALDILGRFSFISTGGGAMLDFLANGTLPGIAALG